MIASSSLPGVLKACIQFSDAASIEPEHQTSPVTSVAAPSNDKSGVIQFQPKLSPSKINAIRKFGMVLNHEYLLTLAN